MTDWQQKNIIINHAVGLHARPSVKLTKTAKGFAAEIQIAAAPTGPWIDAKSIVKVMALKIPQNCTIYFRARGEAANAALDKLVALIARDFEDEPANATGS